MQWIMGRGLKLCLIAIYIEYYSEVDSLQWNIESTSELDYERANTPTSPNCPHSELIYNDDIVYRGWIIFGFIIVHKGILVIFQGFTEDNEQGLCFRLID